MGTVISAVLLVVLLFIAVRQFKASGELDAEKWNIFGQWSVIRYLSSGLWATLKVTVISGLLALPFSILLATLRLSRIPTLRRLAGLYVELLRAIPLLLLIYVFLFGLPEMVHLSLFWKLVLPIALTNAAVLAEIVRAGIHAVPSGQSEAANALGLSYWQVLRLVILPQALRLSAPTLVGQLIRMLKDSTLGYVVSYLELLNSAKVLGEFEHTIIQSYFVVALIYILINGALAAAAGRLDRRTNRPGLGVLGLRAHGRLT